MPAIPLDELPPELLQRVAEYLDHPSALALCLVNRACRVAAIPTVFSSLSFSIFSRDRLKRDAESLCKSLKQADAFKHVRLLEINGDFRYSEYRSKDDHCPWKAGHRVNWDREHQYGIRNRTTDEKGPAFTYEDDHTWKPLAQLVESLPGLRHLVYRPPHQFPPCLLKAVHSSVVGCKLHLLNFSFRSLLDNPFDPYELEIATSPNLATVHVRYGVFDWYYRNDFNDLATLELVAGLAPALEECHLENWPLNGDDQFLEYPPPRGKWRGLPCNRTPRLGKLKSLSIHGTANKADSIDISSSDLAVWPTITDFSALRQLDIGHLEESGFHWLRENLSLTGLSALKLRCDWYRDESTYAVEIPALLGILPPLQELEITGCFNIDCLHRLNVRHARSLRRLALVPGMDLSPMVFSSAQVTWLVKHFPRLEELALSVSRQQGGREEVEMYRMLGSLPRLRSLHLTLDCAIPEQRAGPGEADTMSIEPWFDDFEAKIFDLPVAQGPLLNGDMYGQYQLRARNGHVMKLLLNHAMDQDLAVAIWNVIASSKSELPTLEVLKLRFPFARTQVPGLQSATRILSRWWDIERRMWDDSSTPNVREVKRELDYMYTRLEDGTDEEPPPLFAPVMEKLWPGIVQSKCWKSYWSSRPLWSTAPAMYRMPW
ncbi:hypothetical protein PRZ48_012755 [Zasmidium cellare]|uniref:F-box domain-containing protein n=1 Tax=Zasmidium cellare TaxID=395010 RepID=A0ABR0E5R6_ZASCE|nr:hypothetical protein PRZ48_012755 [Zasmidium cellare]